MKTSRSTYSVFDYAIVITRKHRYFVVAAPEFGLELSSAALQLGQATPLAIGTAVLQLLSRINDQLLERDRAGMPRPRPIRARGWLRTKSLSTSEAARALGVSTSTLRKAVAAGRVPAERTPGGHLRFSPESLAAAQVKVHEGAA